MIDQGSSELNVIVGIKESDFEEAIRVIYNAILRDEKI
jgi:aspartate kinase